MMRKIKFRGKRIDNKLRKWVYGSLIGKDEIEWGDTNGWPAVVDENTIGQYTGLKDVNGKEVYEGDIIRLVDNVFYKHIYEIRWANCGFCLFDKEDEDKYIGQLDEDDVVEVVGNIYDNPELMEEE